MSTLRTNALEGVDAKNSITIVAGAGNITTTNIEQGLAKVWFFTETLGAADASSAVATPDDPCVLTINETKSTLPLPVDILGVDPDGNKKNVLNPTVAIPDDG